MAEPVILELAVNGATPRHRNRHVPRTPAEITEAALAGIESGASIVHNHNDEPMFTPSAADNDSVQVPPTATLIRQPIGVPFSRRRV